MAEIVVALDGDRLIAIRRPPGARPHVEPSPNFGSSPLADWRLADGEEIVWFSGPQAVRLYTGGVSLWQLLMALALGGLRASALELGVAYVKARKAFGVIIGSFQAIQHRLADAVVARDGAQLLVYSRRPGPVLSRACPPFLSLVTAAQRGPVIRVHVAAAGPAARSAMRPARP